MAALLDSFRDSFDGLVARDAAGLGENRRAALDAALEAGIPHARVEAWKYTPLRALERRRFSVPGATARTFDAALVDAIPAPRMVFVNGVLDDRHSDLSGLPESVSLAPLSAVLASGDPRSSNFLARRFERSDEIFARLNAALATEGTVLRVNAGVEVPAPVHLVFIGAPEEGDRACHLRHMIDLREGARLTVVEHHLGDTSHRNLSNHLVHAHLGSRSTLVHARLQDEDTGATVIARTDAVLGRESRYERIDLELGASLSRHELNIALQGEGATVHANGVLLATGRRHLDTRLGIDHTGRDSTSELTWRGLGAGRSRAAFHGGILIREGADGSDAMLSNKNLLLTEGAEIDSQPVLEIHADEVQAAHGATVGQLDPTALFYLRSRGIPSDQARSLLTAAFCRETLAVITDGALRDALAQRLDAALARIADVVA